MTLTSLLNLPVTITNRLPGGSDDIYGNEIPDDAITVTVGELQQRDRTEPALAGETSVADFLLILPAGTILSTGDTATIDGLDYEIVGEPWRARNPRMGRESHVEATVKRVAGAEDGS